MARRMIWLQWATLAALAVGVVLVPSSKGGDIQYIESFAFAKDRTESLKQLIPGTEEYYYFHCLHLLNTEQFDKVEPMTRLWYDRHKQTALLTEIQTRCQIDSAFFLTSGPLPNCFDLPAPTCYILIHLPALPHSPLIDRSGLNFTDRIP